MERGGYYMPSFKYVIELSAEDQAKLTDIVTKGKSPARTILRANILLALDRRNERYMTISEISKAYHTTPTTHCHLYSQLIGLLTFLNKGIIPYFSLQRKTQFGRKPKYSVLCSPICKELSEQNIIINVVALVVT